jgi:hypothetical protein
MNSPKINLMSLRSPKTVIAALFMIAYASSSAAEDAKAAITASPNQAQTNKDVPSDFHKYFGQRVNSWRDRERQIAKLDLDADLNQDGMIQNNDPADGGAFEATPPGLILGEGELTRMIIRLLPYRVDFEGEVVVTLEIEGINRSTKTGDFSSLDEEILSMGHIRVWRDTTKKQLLLDSKDPAKRVVEFTTQYKTYPYNLPLAVPRFVFIEGAKSSPRYTGDIRLLCTVSHRAINDPANANANAMAMTAGKTAQAVTPEQGNVNIKSFRTSFDHLLLTVQKQPTVKEFINNNNEGVWLAPSGWKY